MGRNKGMEIALGLLLTLPAPSAMEYVSYKYEILNLLPVLRMILVGTLFT